MRKRVLTSYIVLSSFIVLFLISFNFFDLNSITGFAIFSQSGGDFDLGTYQNTIYNGSSVIISSGLQGNYTSNIFDAGASATWNNLSWSGNNVNVTSLFCVDGGGDIYKSSDLGINWIRTQENYGRTTATTDMFSNNNYIYTLSSSGNEVWNSSNGSNFAIIYNDFESKSPYVGNANKFLTNQNLYVATGPGEVWKSSDNGITWIKKGDFNPGTQTSKGIAIDNQGYLFAVDGTGAVYKSINDGVDWAQVNADYGGATATDGMEADSLGNLYILLDKKVYKSSNSGMGWAIINDSFTSYSQNGVKMLVDKEDKFFIADSVGRIFKSLNYGVSWVELGDCNNAATNDILGLTDFVKNSNLSFQVRNCSLSDCSGGVWQTKDLSNINLQGRYFQYKVSFTSPSSSATPTLRNVSLNYDLINQAPSVIIVHPQATSYGLNQRIDLNYSASDVDGNLQACWYNLNSGSNVSLANCANITLNLNPGDYALELYANDSYNLVSSASVSFSVVNSAPTISLIEPSQGTTYGYDNNIDLKFSVSDAENNLQACWYNINSGSSIAISNCVDTTFSVSGGGEYTLEIYANDSLNEISSASADFNVQIGAPTVILNSPANNYYTSSNDIVFRYTPSDIDLQLCELWGDFSGTFELNQTEPSPTNGSENTFSLNLQEGNYKWNIRCNDSVGNSAFNGNKTLNIDNSNPQITISQPKGTITSRSSILIRLSISDASPVSCKYNIEWATGGSVISNTTMTNCTSSSFSVAADGNYKFNLFVNDSASNFASSSSDFSVDTSTTPVIPPVDGNSGGGGGGGSYTPSEEIISEIKVSIENPGEIIAYANEEKGLELSVKNTGKSTLNKCKLTGNIISDTVSNIAPGEIIDFVFTLITSESSEDKIINLECVEGTKQISLKITIITPELSLEIISMSLESKKELLVKYYISSNSEKENLVFSVYDENNNLISEKTENIDTIENTKLEKEVILDVSSAENGMLKIVISKENKSLVEENFLYDSRALTGFVALGNISTTSYISLIVIVFLVVAFFLIRRIIRMKKKSKK